MAFASRRELSLAASTEQSPVDHSLVAQTCKAVQGRATIGMDVSLKEVRNRGKFDAKLLIVVDGYNAPITAGNFVDLVDKKFYDGMEIQRADGFIVQTGDPGGDVGTPSGNAP